MNKRNPITRHYSANCRQAVQLLGKLIKVARKERKMTAQEVADRAGISRGFLQRIEKGDIRCEIGAVFEVATIVGVGLFDPEPSRLRLLEREAEYKLTLLPKSVRKPTAEVDDEF